MTDQRLADFLVEFLGGWTDDPGLTIVGAAARAHPGWDGSIREVVGVATPSGGVISVRPELAVSVRTAVPTWADVPIKLPAAVGHPDGRTFSGTFRWTVAPTDLDDVGEWVPWDDPRVPQWLHPFGGDALVAWGPDGTYAAGVGIKRHNPAGMEISVGTEEAHRGQGLAARLVAQAARWILDQGAVPIYLHDPANVASDRTALKAGFPDVGWRIIGVF